MLLYCSKMGDAYSVTFSCRLFLLMCYNCFLCCFLYFTCGLPANTTSEQACSDVMCNCFLMVYAYVSILTLIAQMTQRGTH